jgi:glycosyltransferase involved in cell wall biosynthesis
MERALRSANIHILSHSGCFGRRAPLASIAWIPDFQELTFPEFFSRKELASRHRNAIRCSRHASTVLLSSESALADLKRVGVADVQTSVLQFVATVPAAQDCLPRDELKIKYGLEDRFFHLPNQFWIHKNHRVVIDALALLRRQGHAFQVAATGNAADPRQPGHFSSLTATAAQLGVDDLFKPLGVVPYQDLMGLMRHAVAVINPSKFEGWSTTVEEAKSMGKAIVLSDIAVHREQAPDRAAFFPSDDASVLAEKMLDVMRHWNAASDEQFTARAASALRVRREAFARRYEDIVLNTLARHSRVSDLALVSEKQTSLNR